MDLGYGMGFTSNGAAVLQSWQILLMPCTQCANNAATVYVTVYPPSTRKSLAKMS